MMEERGLRAPFFWLMRFACRCGSDPGAAVESKSRLHGVFLCDVPVVHG